MMPEGIAPASHSRRRRPCGRRARGADRKAGCALTAPLRREQTQAHLRPSGRGLRPGDAPSVVDPERFTSAGRIMRPGRGLLLRCAAQAATARPAAFQSALPPAVLLPESFRGGCSFGAAPPIKSGARPLLRACIRRLLCSTAGTARGQRLRRVGFRVSIVSARRAHLPDLPGRLHSLVQHPDDLDQLRRDRAVIEDVHGPPDP